MKNKQPKSGHKGIENWCLTLREFVFEMKKLSRYRRWSCDILTIFNLRYIIYSYQHIIYAKIVKMSNFMVLPHKNQNFRKH